MQEEKLAGQGPEERLKKVRNEFYEYIDKNVGEISATLPVFFAHIITTLSDSFPGISAETHDEFIDSITYRILAASRQGKNLHFVEKVCENALRPRRARGRSREWTSSPASSS